MSLRKVDTWDAALPLLIITRSSGRPRDLSMWSRVTHQGAGVGCTNFEVDAIILPLKPEVVDSITALTQRWYGTDVGALGKPSLRDINQYDADLRALGLSCNAAYPDFMEGVYPFDFSIDVLRQLTSVALPDDLDELVEFDTPLERAFGSFNAWSAYILGENSD